MPLISERRLLNLAFDALEEAAATAHEQPVTRTWALRLVLAFLASRSSDGTAAGRWPFDHFWQSLAHGREHDRWANINAALNGIYLAVGEKRDMRRVSLFEKRARETGPEVGRSDGAIPDQ